MADEKYEDDFDPEPSPRRTSTPADRDTSAPQEASPKEQSQPVKSRKPLPPAERQGVAEHHFRVSIDLRSIRGLRKGGNVYVRYSYPLFGTSSQSSNPPVAVAKQSESLLPNGFCAFEFYASPSQLTQVFAADPLIVEVLHRDQVVDDIEIGVIKVNMSDLLNAPAYPSQDDGVVALRIIDNYYTIFNVSAPSGDKTKATPKLVKKGALRAVLSLEDFGATGKLLAAEPVGVTRNEHSTGSEGGARQNIEYQVAWEMEMWKRAERAKHTASLKALEQQRLAELEAEFKQYEVQRQSAYAESEKKLTQFEKKLKDAFFDAERKHKQLQIKEEELRLRSESLDRELEQQKHEVLLTVRRLKEQHKHQIALLTRKSADKTKENEVLRKKLEKANKEAEHLALEFAQFKRQHSKSTNGQLRSELAAKDLELQRQQEESLRLRDQNQALKTQLACTLKEMAGIRRKAKKQAEEVMEKERSEVHKLRLQYFAREQQRVLKRDRLELQGIKDEVRTILDKRSNALQQATSKGSSPTLSQRSSTPREVKIEHQQQQHPINLTTNITGDPLTRATEGGHHKLELARLEQQRDDLLGTGVYTMTHPILQGLQAQIEALQSQKPGTSNRIGIPQALGRP